MKMRMANILKEAEAVADVMAVQHCLRRQSGWLLLCIPEIVDLAC